MAKKAKEAEAAKQAAEALAEKQRLAEEAKIAEAAEMAKKAKEAEQAKIASSEILASDEPTAAKDVEVNNAGAIIFKVQLLASSKVIPLEAENFNGLGVLSKEPIKNLYRYMYGSSSSYKEAEMLKSNADSKGYPDSYIVAYKDGERITITEALKYANE